MKKKTSALIQRKYQRPFSVIAKFVLFVLLAAGVFGFGGSVRAATINAASCSRTHVQTAIDSASTEDTIIVPTGQCTWNSSVTIPTGATLQGAGVGKTIIVRSGTAPAVFMGDNSRLTGFEFTSAGIRATTVQGFRIDHCKVTHTSAYGGGLTILGNDNGAVGGLVDHCEFINVRLVSFGTLTNSDALWFKSLNFGSPDNTLYVEDCTWNNTTQSSATDGRLSGQYVIRFCTLNNAYFEAHGARDSRGIRGWEIYRNMITNDYPPMTNVFNIRGGTGLIFDNTATGNNNNADDWYFGMERATFSYPYSGLCDGTSLWDGNEDATGYLCRDQIGAGPDTQLGDSVEANPPYSQTKVPAYLWNNTWDGSSANVYVHAGDGTLQQIENRDWYIDASSNAGVMGGGVIIGTLANRSVTCIKGVGYWATDQGEWNSKNPGADGQLYKCTATDTWELYYTPYTYPHPLTLLGENDITPPSRSNPQPTGTLSSGTTSTTISLTTNETAECKYSANAGTNYDLMENTFVNTNATSHSQTITNLSDGDSKTYYVRCQDESNNQNTDDFEISFSVALPSTTYSISNFINLVTNWLQSGESLESDVLDFTALFTFLQDKSN